MCDFLQSEFVARHSLRLNSIVSKVIRTVEDPLPKELLEAYFAAWK